MSLDKFLETEDGKKIVDNWTKAIDADFVTRLTTTYQMNALEILTKISEQLDSEKINPKDHTTLKVNPIWFKKLKEEVKTAYLSNLMVAIDRITLYYSGRRFVVLKSDTNSLLWESQLTVLA